MATSEDGAECAMRGPRTEATALRGVLSEPDPRSSATLSRKGFTLNQAGIARALSLGEADPTAQLAALTAVSVMRCRALLPRVEAELAAPPPTAVEAAATLAELGTDGERTRGMNRLRAIARDPTWPEAQITAAAYLARGGEAAGVAVFRAALRSANEAARLQAVVGISACATFDGKIVDGQPFSRLAELTTLLTDPASSWLVRREAVYQVAKLPRSREQSALLGEVADHDADERVRRAAALRLDHR